LPEVPRSPQAATGFGPNALVKSVVTDFSSGEARSAARDGLKTKICEQQAGRNERHRLRSGGIACVLTGVGAARMAVEAQAVKACSSVYI
jgi:hypothetical protein